MDLRPFLVFAGAGAFLWAINRWRRTVPVVMVLLVFEGAIRKWLFPSAQDLVYLAKDVLLLGVYIGFLRENAHHRYRATPLPALYTSLALGAMVGLLEIFNPRLPNFAVGILGFKAYFLYVPLLFVMPAVFDSDRELVQFLRRYILISIPVGLLGMAQFLSPASSFLNTYARPDENAAYVSTFGSSEFVRVTATFSYITGYGSYLVAMTILVLAYLGATRWKVRPSIVAYAALGMAGIGMLMTGSRGPVLMLAILFPIYWWLAVIRGAEGGATFGRLLVGLTLLGALAASVGSDALGAFLGRAAGTEDVAERLTLPFISPWETLPDAGPLGYGIGATHQTAAAVTPGIVPYSWLEGRIFEVESGRIMLELGPAGFLFVYFARIYLVFLALRQVFALRTAFHRAIATACLMFFLAQLPGSIVFDVTSDLFFWFFGGLLMTVMRLDRIAMQKARRAAAAAAGAGTAAAGAPRAATGTAARTPRLPAPQQPASGPAG